MQAVLAAPTTGRSFPIGATLVPGGANFSIFSRSAAKIELLFFDRVDDARPSRVIPIDPCLDRTYHYWRLFVSGVQAGQIYGFRRTVPSSQIGVSGSIHPSCYWTRTVARLSCRRTTAVKQPV